MGTKNKPVGRAGGRAILDYPTKEEWIKQMSARGLIKEPEKIDNVRAFLQSTQQINETEDVNPFTKAKTKLTDELKRDEREARDLEIKKKLTLPVIAKTTKSSSFKVLAGHKVKRFIYLEQLKQEVYKHPPTKFERDLISQMRECPIILYKHLRKELCLMNHAINKKQEEMEHLSEKVDEEERWIEKEFRQLEIDKNNYDSAMTLKCRQATEAIRKADKITKERLDLCENISKSTFKYAHLNTECLKLEDILENLIKYKKFIDFVAPQELKAMYLEKRNHNEIQQKMSSKKKKTKIKHVDKVENMNISNALSPVDSQNTDEAENKNIQHIQDAANTKSFNEGKDKHIRSMPDLVDPQDMYKAEEANKSNVSDHDTSGKDKDKESSHRVESPRVRGLESTSSHSSTGMILAAICKSSLNGKEEAEDIPLYFSDPKEMRDILMELEESNLRVIQNVQDQEELIEETRESIKKFHIDSEEEKEKLQQQIEKSGEQLAKIDEEIQKMKDAVEYLDSFKQLERYESLFYFGRHDYVTVDQMLGYLERIVKDTYESVFGPMDTTQDCVAMLKRIESQMDQLHLKSKVYPRGSLNRQRDILYELKRQQARKRQLRLMKEMNEEKLRRTEAKARMPAKVKSGRPLMKRSQPPIKEVPVEIIDWAALEHEEEMRFFFS